MSAFFINKNSATLGTLGKLAKGPFAKGGAEALGDYPWQAISSLPRVVTPGKTLPPTAPAVAEGALPIVPRKKKQTPYAASPAELAEAIRAAAWLSTVSIPDGLRLRPWLTVSNAATFKRNLAERLQDGPNSPTVKTALRTARAVRVALQGAI